MFNKKLILAGLMLMALAINVNAWNTYPLTYGNVSKLSYVLDYSQYNDKFYFMYVDPDDSLYVCSTDLATLSCYEIAASAGLGSQIDGGGLTVDYIGDVHLCYYDTNHQSVEYYMYDDELNYIENYSMRNVVDGGVFVQSWTHQCKITHDVLNNVVIGTRPVGGTNYYYFRKVGSGLWNITLRQTNSNDDALCSYPDNTSSAYWCLQSSNGAVADAIDVVQKTSSDFSKWNLDPNYKVDGSTYHGDMVFDSSGILYIITGKGAMYRWNGTGFSEKFNLNSFGSYSIDNHGNTIYASICGGTEVIYYGASDSWLNETTSIGCSGEDSMYIGADGNRNILYTYNQVVYIASSVPTYDYFGSIFDLMSGEIITGQEIIISFQSGSSTFNDVTYDGTYSISNIPEGTYNLTVITSGYDTYSESILVSGDLEYNIYLVDEDYNGSTSYYRMIFVDSVSLNPITGNTVALTYAEGCNCQVGTNHYRSTDNNGIISGYLPKGTYNLELRGYQILENDGFYNLQTQVNLENDFYKTFFAKVGNQSYTLNITFFDSKTYEYLSGVRMVIWNERYLVNKTSDDSGNALFYLPESTTYHYTIKKDGYEPADGPLTVNSNKSIQWLLIPLASNELYVTVNITDCVSNQRIEGASIQWLNDKGEYTYLFNGTTDSNGIAIINMPSGPFRPLANKEGYVPYESGYYIIEHNRTYSFCMINYTNVSTYCVSGNVTYNGIGVRGLSVTAKSLDWRSYHQELVTNTNNNGYYSICDLYEDTYYNIEINGYPSFEDESREVFIQDSDVTAHFNLTLLVQTYKYDGYFIYNNLDIGRMIPVQDVQATMVHRSTNKTYSTKSNKDGYFIYTALPSGTYDLYASKTFYKPYTHEVKVLGDRTVPEMHYLESSEKITTLNVDFVDENDTILKNVRATIESEYADQVLTSNDYGRISTDLPYGEYTLNYIKENYRPGSKTVYLDESNNYYKIEMELSDSKIMGIDYGGLQKWNEADLADLLWRIGPPILIIMILVAVYKAITS